jgi:hypothetical protein
MGYVCNCLHSSALNGPLSFMRLARICGKLLNVLKTSNVSSRCV